MVAAQKIAAPYKTFQIAANAAKQTLKQIKHFDQFYNIIDLNSIRVMPTYDLRQFYFNPCTWQHCLCSKYKE